MAKTINEARSHEATKRFFSYQAPDPDDEPPPGTNMTIEQWHSLSPGYRRAISRDFAKQAKAPAPVDPQYAEKVMTAWDDMARADRREFLDKKRAVEAAAKQRL